MSPKPTSEYLLRLNAALALREIPDTEAALSQLERAVELAPDDSNVHLVLGLTYQDLSRWEEAEKHFRQTILLTGDSEEARQALGILCMRTARYGEALQLLDSISSADVHNVSARRAYAIALKETGNVDLAIDILSETHKHAPEDVDTSLQLSKLYIDNEQFDDAIAVAAKTLEVNPTQDLNRVLVEAYIALSRFEDAIATSRKLLASGDNAAATWEQLAFCYLQKHDSDPQAALEAVEEALKLDSDLVMSHQFRAQALIELGRHDEAEQELTSAIEKAESSSRSVFQSALLHRMRLLHLLKIKGPTKALEQVERDLSSLPDSVELLRFKMSAQFALRKFDDVLVTLELAERKGMDRKQVALDRFFAYNALGRTSEAEGILTGLVANGENVDDLLDSVSLKGISLYQIGFPDKALEVFKQGLAIDPENPRLLNNCGFVYACNGNWSQAERYLIQSMACGYDDRFIHVCNLSYVLLSQHKVEEAKILLDTVDVDEISLETTALLHIPLVESNGTEIVVAERKPNRFLPIRIATAADKVSASYLLGQVAAALKYANDVISSFPNNIEPYLIRGCVTLAEGDNLAAHKDFEIAASLADAKSERGLVNFWLNRLDSCPPTSD